VGCIGIIQVRIWRNSGVEHDSHGPIVFGVHPKKMITITLRCSLGINRDDQPVTVVADYGDA